MLKPIDPEELAAAFVKFETVFQKPQSYDNNVIASLLQNLQQKSYKERFLVKTGQQLSYIEVKDIAYFYSEDKLVCAKNVNGKRHILDYTLDQLEDCLDPACYFRINRKFLTELHSISKIHTYFNSRLKLELKPKTELEVIVSRERVSNFKEWLDK